MTLVKAIKIINAYIDDPLVTNRREFIKALKIGAEALVRLQNAREEKVLVNTNLLPSETEH